MEHPGSFAVVEITLAIEAARIPGDGELHLLLAGLGDVEPDKGAHRPGRIVRGVPTVLMVDQCELNLARRVGVLDGPASGERFRGAGDERADKCADNKNVSDDSVTAVHDFPPV